MHIIYRSLSFVNNNMVRIYEKYGVALQKKRILRKIYFDYLSKLIKYAIIKNIRHVPLANLKKEYMS